MIDPTEITVIICTYNRCQSLKRTIESVAAQTLSHAIAWEIVVVDNNSSDETYEVVEDFRSKYPERFRYICEPQQGVSRARNAGILAARGDILAFIDDDETADPKWLENLTSNLRTGEWAGAGGRVVPPSDFSPPSWLSLKSSFAKGPLAAFDLGIEPGQLNEPPFGANMAFRKKVFDQFGGFRTDLGRSGKSMISNEDTELGRRLMAAGLRLRYEPSALTYHPVEEKRLLKQYFLDWWFNKGRSDRLELGNPSNGLRFLGVPFFLIRALLWTVLRWIVSLHPSPRFAKKIEVWNYAGQIYECYRQRIDSRRKTEASDPSPGQPRGGGN